MITFKLKTVDSTSRFLKSYIHDTELCTPVLCVADRQTSGYGQYDRIWQSEHSSLTFTFAFPLTSSLIHPSTSLMAACFIRSVLMEYSDSPLYVKWPNDVYDNDGKISGCLLEVVRDVKKQYVMAIGIGVNLALPEFKINLSSKVSFVNVDDKYELLDKLLCKLLKLMTFGPSDRNEALNAFNEVDYFSIGQRVIVYDCDTQWPGEYLGLNPDGFPVILINGTHKIFNSGRISIRPT